MGTPAGGQRIQRSGDITAEHVDAIVNRRMPISGTAPAWRDKPKGRADRSGRIR
jgi:hypothetical protein